MQITNGTSGSTVEATWLGCAFTLKNFNFFVSLLRNIDKLDLLSFECHRRQAKTKSLLAVELPPARRDRWDGSQWTGSQMALFAPQLELVLSGKLHK